MAAASPVRLERSDEKMDFGQSSSWAHYAQQSQNTPTDTDRTASSHFGQNAYHLPSLQLDQTQQTHAATDASTHGEEEFADPLTAFLNPAPRQEGGQNMEYESSQYHGPVNYNYPHLSANTGPDLASIANLLGGSSNFQSKDEPSNAETTSPNAVSQGSYSSSVGLPFPAHHTASPGSHQQGQHEPYGGEASSSSSAFPIEQLPQSNTVQRRASIGSFAHLLAEPQPDQLSWAHQRHYSYGNMPYGATANTAGSNQVLLPPFNPSFDMSSGGPSGSKEKPALSLLTDTGTLTGGWDSSQASAATYNSAASLVGPELTFSADPTTTTNTSFTTSGAERMDAYADGLHPDSAIDGYGKQGNYFHYRGRESSPLSASSDSRSRQQSPFSTSPYDEFPSITIRQPAEQLSSPYSATAFHDIKPSPTTRYIHPPSHRPTSSSSTHALPMSSQGVQQHQYQNRESPLVPRMAAFGLRDLNNASSAVAETQSWARLPSRPDSEAEVQAMLR